MRDLAQVAMEAALAAGASYADVRAERADHESITVQDERVDGVGRQSSAGVGVRVVVDGSWGFAATSRRTADAVAATARLAAEIARASGRARGRPVELDATPAVVARWATPHTTDPFDVGLDDKLALLLAATGAARAVDGLTLAKATFDAWRTDKLFVSSEGAAIEQQILHVGGGVECVAVGDGDVQTRSYPNSFRGYCGSGGWEDITALDLAGQAPTYAEQAVALLAAPVLPSDRTTVILDGSQVALQVHESVGHPLELDRIYGWEAAYAGTSFVRPEDFGALRYGSPLVNLTLDSTTPGALGTFGFDDEGTPAGRTPLVVEGVLRQPLTSRETAAQLGATTSNGTMRADSWGSLPLIRMSNIHLEPGDGTLEELIGDTDRGVYLETNRSWSIDDRRVNFQFGCEAAWEIRGGRRGRLYRNPTYTGRTTAFWGGCDAIAGSEEWRVYGTPNCGKGQPSQTARVAHGAAPARFRDVEVGV